MVVWGDLGLMVVWLMLPAGVLEGMGPGKGLVDCATLEVRQQQRPHGGATSQVQPARTGP